jgi:hypothetical protein
VRINPIGEFNYKYARYNADYREKQHELTELGMRFNDWPFPIGNSRATAYTSADCVGKYKQILDILCDITDCFERTRKDDPDYMNDTPATKSRESLEKIRQQQMFAANFNNTDFFIFDMEYAQARNNKNISVGDDVSSNGRFDLQGLRKISQNRYELVLIELKSNAGACNGQSGMNKHLSDICLYLRDANNYGAIRIRDAYKIMDANRKFFNVNWQIENTISDEVKKLFIFTDTAASYAANPRGTVQKLLKNNILRSDELLIIPAGDNYVIDLF